MKYMYQRCVHFFNTFIIVVALAASACHSSSTNPSPGDGGNDGGTPASYQFCWRLYNVQSNLQTKMAPCDELLSRPFRGFDVPGFPPNPGYCGETVGKACEDYFSALDSLESCVATMPVCNAQDHTRWEEQWRFTCLNVFKKATEGTSCSLSERN